MQHGSRSPTVCSCSQSWSNLEYGSDSIWRCALDYYYTCVSFILTANLATLTFYIQTWEEYYTQTLVLGIVSGPVEGILTLCIVYLFTAVKGGGSFWQKSMLETVGIAKSDSIPDYIYELPFNQWFMVYGGIVLSFNTIQR